MKERVAIRVSSENGRFGSHVRKAIEKSVDTVSVHVTFSCARVVPHFIMVLLSCFVNRRARGKLKKRVDHRSVLRLMNNRSSRRIGSAVRVVSGFVSFVDSRLSGHVGEKGEHFEVLFLGI